MQTDLSSSRVNFVSKNASDAIIYFHNDEFGYIELTCKRVINGQEITISHRMKGKISLLQSIVSEHFSAGGIPGVVIVHEFLESQVSSSLKTIFYDSKKSSEKAVVEYLKKNPVNGEQVIISGERVVRITEFVRFPGKRELNTLINEIY